ncbi:MAG TPA: L-serine ammonia-lyase, iron-sulfur-dependent, subunit alpha, partial [Candidatus Deferrimicrobium sp.]|nr:L-serine ammonia-lyase, iron-sulfur-dependent, subunit alpha [Candidatus Deferrimicrobium sp.]
TYCLGDFKEFADNVELQEVGFMNDAIVMNSELAERGLKNADNWGSKLRRLLLDRGVDADKSLMHYPVILAMCAVYERMSGAEQPAMTLTGSGNQGIGAILPLVAIKRIEDISNEVLIRSVSLACLVTIYTKSYTGVLSPICGGGSITSSAVSGGIVYMMRGSLQQIENALQNTFASTAGMLCDGAKTNCALKVATGTSAAISNALLALDGVVVPDKDGIVSASVEGTIENLGYLVDNGMRTVDKTIIDILLNSKEGQT